MKAFETGKTSELHKEYDSTPLGRIEAMTRKQLIDCEVPVDFPESVVNQTESDLCVEASAHHRDLRNLYCLTIDSADTKDIDDAISLERTGNCYKLYVHIADVATYAPPNSEYESIALNRGTSIYLPHLTIPMLPSILSDHLCSLNPSEDKLAITAIITLDLQGKVTDFELTKSQICSRVKGIYSEINELLAGACSPDIKHKYEDAESMLLEMHRLAMLLRKDREKNGANIHNRLNPKPVFQGTDILFYIEESGPAQIIIEEFMVLANRLVAAFLHENKLPVIYRVQEKARQEAVYAATEIHHAELALERYSHFTSPIRRLSDLKIHQVLTAFLMGIDNETIWAMFGNSMKEAAELATVGERRSDNITRPCLRYCSGLFLMSQVRNEFDAVAIGYMKKNQVLFYLRKNGITVPGIEGLKPKIGQRFAVKLAIADEEKAIVNVVSCIPIRRAA